MPKMMYDFSILDVVYVLCKKLPKGVFLVNHRSHNYKCFWSTTDPTTTSVFGQPLIPQLQVFKAQLVEKLVFTACKNPTVTKSVW